MKSQKQNSGGIYFERKMYQSKAFCSLTKNGMKFLFAVLDQRQRNPAFKKSVKKGFRAERFVDLDKIEVPYETAHKKYGIPVTKVSTAIDDCMAKGFIDITHQGGKGEHDKSTYALLEDYLTWEPGQVIRKRPKDARRGYRGKRLGASAPKCRECGTQLKHDADISVGICADCIFEN